MFAFSVIYCWLSNVYHLDWMEIWPCMHACVQKLFSCKDEISNSLIKWKILYCWTIIYIYKYIYIFFDNVGNLSKIYCAKLERAKICLVSWDINLLCIFHICLQRWNVKSSYKMKRKEKTLYFFIKKKSLYCWTIITYFVRYVRGRLLIYTCEWKSHMKKK